MPKLLRSFFLHFFKMTYFLCFWSFLVTWILIRYYAGHALGKPYLGALVAGICHSVCVCLVALIGLLQLDDSNQSDQLNSLHYVLLVFSGTYFCNDFYVVTCIRYSLAYVLHHIASMIGLFAMFHGGSGAKLICELALLAECTNPLQNICEMFRELEGGKDNPHCKVLRGVFRVVFLMTRGPVFGMMFYRWYSNETFLNLRYYSSSSLSPYIVEVTVWAIFLGSFSWIFAILKSYNKKSS